MKPMTNDRVVAETPWCRVALILVALLVILSGACASSGGDAEASSDGSGAQSAAAPGNNGDDLEVGAQVFASTCAGCHGAEGQGSPKAPSLMGIAIRQPDRTRQISTVTYGRGEMIGRDRLLTPEEIDAVVSFIRESFVESESTDGY